MRHLIKERDVVQLVKSHFASLWMELQCYFPELSEMESNFIRNLFIVNEHLLPDNMQEEFLVLQKMHLKLFPPLSSGLRWLKFTLLYLKKSWTLYWCSLVLTYVSKDFQCCWIQKLNIDHDWMLCMTYECACLILLLKLRNLLVTNRHSPHTEVHYWLILRKILFHSYTCRIIVKYL